MKEALGEGFVTKLKLNDNYIVESLFTVTNPTAYPISCNIMSYGNEIRYTIATDSKIINENELIYLMKCLECEIEHILKL